MNFTDIDENTHLIADRRVKPGSSPDYYKGVGCICLEIFTTQGTAIIALPEQSVRAIRDFLNEIKFQ